MVEDGSTINRPGAVSSGPPAQVLPPDRVPFHALATGFDKAMHAVSIVHQIDIGIAGYPVRVRIAGNTWFDVVRRAVAHLPRMPEGTTPSLHIDAWDAAETHIAMPPCDVNGHAPLVVMKMSEDGRHVGEDREHSRLWLDQQTHRMICSTQSAHHLNLDERARPFHKLLSHWLEQRQVQFLHAGLVAANGRGLLFAGNGGAGKSTSSISCLRGGMHYLGDDFVGFSQHGRTFTGYGLYASCLLDSHHLLRFPDLTPHALPPHFPFEHKHVLYLDDAFKGALRSEQRIDALILPRIVDRHTTGFEPATRMQGLRALAPTSVMYLPRPNRAAFERIAALAESVPSFWLNLGRDIDSIAPALRTLIDGLPRATPEHTQTGSVTAQR